MEGLQSANSTAPTSIEKFMGSEQPSIQSIAVALGPLVVVSGFFLLLSPLELKPWQTSLHVLWQGFSDLGVRFWLDVIFLYTLWPIGAFVAHLLARVLRLQAPFFRELHITGKVWVLCWVAYSSWNITSMLFTSIGWHDFAKAWYVFWAYVLLGGGILWVLPAAAKATYGPGAHWAFLKMFLVLLGTLLLVILICTAILFFLLFIL